MGNTGARKRLVECHDLGHCDLPVDAADDADMGGVFALMRKRGETNR